ncbi:Uu.00g039800.m01.CDS01 [Anthostomella pinea]|uniref:Uu.00g039800.m01.CDS01 n=1 Tax=Anthostomella pinea TaxID=933095 RepID=A0AAI8VAK4_9PEZI|nr:Uu.00g039800.m01.CDS01 [Anthostomella pinea]
MTGPSALASPHASPHGPGHRPPPPSLAPTTSAFPAPGLSEPEPTPEPDHHHHADPPRTILTFSDVPTDLLQLHPLHERRIDANNNTAHINSSLPPIKPPTHQARKPSPGLAARLKALGFGSARQSSPSPTPSQNERIGRLPEDQLRLLDITHQSNSAGLVVERRGRPWKGAGAPLQLLRSRSSRDSFRDSFLKRDDQESVPLPEQPGSLSRPELLPEITESPPLDMDTNKYRLPDHTNGNGTKATLDTRREHIERDTRAPGPEVETPPPPPLPKDTPPEENAPSDYVPDLTSYFNPLGLQRPGSIYTISRASFANQLAQLTALQLPDAELLSSKVAAIPTAQAAAKALIGAAEQIRSWISKASEVIGGLDSDDDVEWAAAGGREGYEEVENAITRFEELINVYVGAIEELQNRRDIASVSNEDLQRAVMQMESIMNEWRNIRTTLNSTKGQVETAMEWEELWGMVLGDIQNEMDELSRLIFEMEERRHKSIMAVSNGDSVDIGDLETIVEETPPAVARNNRFSLPAFPHSPSSPGTPSLNQDDSSLLALFARMQPLRASLDFLPMRLSVFDARASGAFPTACEELEMRREGLEASYKKLEKDADSLRKELGEDKWVLVFRGAGRQAQKMIESVDFSMAKLREGVDQGLQLSNPAVMSKKIESYEAKKTHYGPAIERVLSIIDKGVKDRLTVNGEILRLHAEMQSKWEDLRRQIKDMDITMEEIDKKGEQLRDSISSMLSNDRSTIASGRDTPGSSPPSSVTMSTLGLDPITPSAKGKGKERSSVGSSLPQPSSARRSGSGLTASSRRTIGSRLSTLSGNSNLSTPPRSGSATPLGSNIPRSASSMSDSRPRWNGSTNTINSDIGHNFKPLTLTTPSPYAKRSPTPVRSGLAITPASRESKLPLRSPLARESSASPIPEDTPSKRGVPGLSFRERIAAASPGPHAQQALPKPRQRLASQASTSAIDNRRASLQPPRGLDVSSNIKPRSVSSMAPNRRTSMLPQPKAKEDTITGRRSAAGSRTTISRESTAADDHKPPRWRF